MIRSQAGDIISHGAVLDNDVTFFLPDSPVDIAEDFRVRGRLPGLRVTGMNVDDARTLIPAFISSLGNFLRELGEIGIGFFP